MLRPPIGVAILGFYALMAGVANLFVGLYLTGYVVFGEGSLGEGIFLWGVLTIIVAAIYVAVAVALWSMQPWAWVFANFMAIFGVVNAVFVTIAASSLGAGLATALLPLVVLWYMNRPEIRDLFEAGGPPAA